MVLSKKRITKALIRLRGCGGWSAPVLFASPGRQVFSRRGPYSKIGYDALQIANNKGTDQTALVCTFLFACNIIRFVPYFRVTTLILVNTDQR